ncbi:conserved hypothetical protein [Paraburkholderia atlantica]|uniref:Uncharacterized protein n=1 Tax=Paraburkholderia atlantica TaxID=2654982 RepID=D5WLT7_PARAM|nr:hypothetical protein [Paraburkholderia atlantica]ADG20183.1 conserved hypothetical protein [Paraburkholderia atlantica]
MMHFSNAVRGTAIAVSLAASFFLGGCQNKAEPSAENFTNTITHYLAERGHLCVAKYDWPIHVADQDAVVTHSRDALQLPVMEKLGLVKSTAMMVERTGEDGARIEAPGREYVLTDEGKKFYLHNPVVVATPGKTVTHDADLCVATLSLDKVVGWEPPLTRDGETRTSVLYTYKIDPAPFARTSEFQRVFPMVARVIEGAGTMQLREGVRLTKEGWVAEEYFVR